MEKEKIEIVRCKNCVGILPEGRKKHRCDIFRMFGKDDFYCVYGKNQENNKRMEN